MSQTQTQAAAGAGEFDALEPGRTVGRYRVLRLLGRGGMGAVYLAERADVSGSCRQTTDTQAQQTRPIDRR